MLYRHIKLHDRNDIEKEIVEETGIDPILLRDFISHIYTGVRYSMNRGDGIRVDLQNIGFFKLRPVKAADALEEIKKRIKIIIKNEVYTALRKKARIELLQRDYEHLTKKLKKYDKKNNSNTKILRKYGYKEYREYMDTLKKSGEVPDLPFD